MGYLIAAYGVVFVSVLVYAVQLVRERRTLEKELTQGANQIPVDKRSAREV